jgi:hypothetical protein
MASTVDIINKGYALLGQTNITDLSDQSPEALAARLTWELMLKRVLRGHKWNCLKARAVLNRLVEVPAFGFSYYYQLPSKCLMAIALDGGEYFEIEGRRLLTDAATAELHYIEYSIDTTLFDAQLADALAYFFAAEQAYPMTSSTSLSGQLLKEAEKLLADAKASDAFEGKQRDPRGKKLLNAKYGGRVTY